jgi:hypothetical protein
VGEAGKAVPTARGALEKKRRSLELAWQQRWMTVVEAATGAQEVGGGRVLTPNLEEKLKLGVAMVEGGSGGDVHDAGAGQGMRKKKEDNS